MTLCIKNLILIINKKVVWKEIKRYIILIGDIMSKEDYFRLFRETGKIEYYLEYKKLSRKEK